MAPPPGGTPPSGAPDPSAALDTAEDALSRAAEIRDRASEVRDRVGEARERLDELTTDEDEDAEPIVVEDETAEVVFVDYSRTWEDAPPRKEVVVTRVVHRHPPPPPPEPEPAVAEPPRVRGFIGASVRGTAVNTNPSALSGARAGFTFDDRFTIGGAFYSLTARYGGPIVDPRGNHLGLRMAYGSVLLAWTVYQGRLLHVSLESLAGAGAACVSTNERYYGRWSCLEKVGIVSLEPGVEVGLAVTDWARVSLAGGYRFVTREAWRPPNDFTLSGPYLGLNVDFGYFGEQRRRR